MSLPIQFGHLGTFHSPIGWVSEIHSHPFHEVISLTRGRIFFSAGDGDKKEASAGDLIVIPRGLVHQETPVKGARIGMLYLGFEGPPPAFSILADRRGRVHSLMQWILADRLEGPTTDYRQVLTESILHELAHLSRPARPSLVDLVRAYFREHLSEAVRLDELSKAVDEDKFSLLRRYKKALGRTPMEDLRLMRLEHARDMILGGDGTLREVAEVSGFANEFQLSRAFSRAFGMAPGRFRQQQRKP